MSGREVAARTEGVELAGSEARELGQYGRWREALLTGAGGGGLR